jgi:hypothetical protein
MVICKARALADVRLRMIADDAPSESPGTEGITTPEPEAEGEGGGASVPFPTEVPDPEIVRAFEDEVPSVLPPLAAGIDGPAAV